MTKSLDMGRGVSWKAEEDVILFHSMMAHTFDPVLGKDQKGDEFYSKVCEEFRNRMMKWTISNAAKASRLNLPIPRERDSCMHRWKDLLKGCRLYESKYSLFENNAASGTNADKWKEDADRAYFTHLPALEQAKKTPRKTTKHCYFRFHHVWELMRDTPLLTGKDTVGNAETTTMHRISMPRLQGRDKAKKAILAKEKEERMRSMICEYSESMKATLAPVTSLAQQQKEQQDLQQLQMGLSVMKDSLGVLHSDSEEYKEMYTQYTILCKKISRTMCNVMTQYEDRRHENLGMEGSEEQEPDTEDRYSEVECKSSFSEYSNNGSPSDFIDCGRQRDLQNHVVAMRSQASGNWDDTKFDTPIEKPNINGGNVAAVTNDEDAIAEESEQSTALSEKSESSVAMDTHGQLDPQTCLPDMDCTAINLGRDEMRSRTSSTAIEKKRKTVKDSLSVTINDGIVSLSTPGGLDSISPTGLGNCCYCKDATSTLELRQCLASERCQNVLHHMCVNEYTHSHSLPEVPQDKPTCLSCHQAKLHSQTILPSPEARQPVTRVRRKAATEAAVHMKSTAQKLKRARKEKSVQPKLSKRRRN